MGSLYLDGVRISDPPLAEPMPWSEAGRVAMDRACAEIRRATAPVVQQADADREARAAQALSLLPPKDEAA